VSLSYILIFFQTGLTQLSHAIACAELSQDHDYNYGNEDLNSKVMELNEFAERRTQEVPVQLDNGAVIKIEVAQTGREDVAFDLKSFKPVTDALEGVTKALSETLEKTKPNKATIKFGMELAIESGQLTAVIVKGSSKANLEVTLEWSK
jgi:Trypsin-co-occurring domain 1